MGYSRLPRPLVPRRTTWGHYLLFTSVDYGEKKHASEREHHGASGPPPAKVGALLQEAVDDDAVAVDRGVLVVQRVNERLAQVEQSLLCFVQDKISFFLFVGGGGKNRRNCFSWETDEIMKEA